MSQRKTTPTIRPVLPAKTQIGLSIYEVELELNTLEVVEGACDQRRLSRVDCADAQADLSLAGRKNRIAGFVVC